MRQGREQPSGASLERAGRRGAAWRCLAPQGASLRGMGMDAWRPNA